MKNNYNSQINKIRRETIKLNTIDFNNNYLLTINTDQHQINKQVL